MTKSLWQFTKALPLILGASLMAQSVSAAPEDNLNVTPASSEATAQHSATSDNLPVAMPALATQADGLDLLRRRQQLKKFNAAPISDQGMSQVTSVSELRDVQPTEWAYEALKSLVERYGCIVGYPDRTFRGNRALSRWEFAAGLNACMNVMERLLQENVAVIREDIDKLKALAQQFEQELAALGARVDNLESRISYLEDHQFSTTTKLNANAVFMVADQFGNDKALNWRQQNAFDNGQRLSNARLVNPSSSSRAQGKTPVDEIATLSTRIRFNFDTSFTGKDLLRTRIQAGTIPNLSGATGTNMARLGTDVSPATNAAFIEKVFYRSKLGDNLTFWVGGAGLNLDDVFNVYNPYLASSETGALSRFARYNPLVFRGPEGTGTAVKYDFSKQFNVIATYLAGSGTSNDTGNIRAAEPSNRNGLFNGEFSTGAQINYQVTNTLGFGFTYLHSYFVDDYPTISSSGVNVTSSTGSLVASNPFFGAPTTRDSYGLSGSWKISDNISLSATGVYASLGATGLDVSGTYRSGSADLWSWNAGLSVLDLGKEGAVLSVAGGLMPYAPYVSNLPGDPINNDRNAPYMIETQYKYPVNKNIILTPGFYVVFNPEGNGNNSSIWVGALRTTFLF